MMWGGWTTSRPKPKSKFNGLQDMTGIDKVPVKVVEEPEARVARKIAATKEIVDQVQREQIRRKPKVDCNDCVFQTRTWDEHRGHYWYRCNQPFVTQTRVEHQTIMSQETQTSEARQNVELCGPDGDLFFEKTWWQKNGGKTKVISFSLLTLLILIGILASAILHFGIGYTLGGIVGLMIIGIIGFGSTS